VDKEGKKVTTTTTARLPRRIPTGHTLTPAQALCLSHFVTLQHLSLGWMCWPALGHEQWGLGEWGRGDEWKVGP